jgi:hypothetical protein
VLREVRAESNVDRFLGSFQATLSPFESLSITGLVGIDDSREENVLLQPPYSVSSTFTGSISNPVRSITKWNSDVTANLETGFSERLALTSTAGFRYTADRINTIRTGAENLPPGQETVGGATQFASQAVTELRTVGGFLQERLSINDRLFLTGAMNIEASSAFGADERWQLFPRLGASWVVHEEPFFDGSALSGALSTFRVRASYGETGGQPPAAYTIFNNFSEFNFGGRPGQAGDLVLANPGLKPERQREWEGGFDVGFFNDRALVEFTYYDQRTEDLVLRVPLQLSSGFDVQFQNIGTITNRGVELTLGADLLQGRSFGWETRLTYAANRNKVEKMRTAADTIFSEYLNVVTEGEPVGVFVGNVFERNADGSLFLDAAGRPRRLRRNGVLVKELLGDPNPDFTAALNNDFTFGDDLRLSVPPGRPLRQRRGKLHPAHPGLLRPGSQHRPGDQRREGGRVRHPEQRAAPGLRGVRGGRLVREAPRGRAWATRSRTAWVRAAGADADADPPVGAATCTPGPTTRASTRRSTCSAAAPSRAAWTSSPPPSRAPSASALTSPSEEAGMGFIKQGNMRFRLVAALAAALGAGGCELDLTNPNSPPAELVLSTPDGIIALATGMQGQYAGTGRGYGSGAELRAHAGAGHGRVGRHVAHPGGGPRADHGPGGGRFLPGRDAAVQQLVPGDPLRRGADRERPGRGD